jgi:hypothetical protein
MTATSNTTGIRLRLLFVPTSPLFLILRPEVEIDGGVPQQMRWGSKFVPLSPGRHWARAYVTVRRYPMGDSTVEFVVKDGDVTYVRWLVPPIPMLRGWWKVRHGKERSPRHV